MSDTETRQTPLTAASDDTLTSPTTVIAFAMLAIVAGTLVGVFMTAPAEVISTIAGTVVGTGLGTMLGYYFTSSRSMSQALTNTPQPPRPGQASPAP